MKNNKAVWILITIFLGALGSGLWDFILEPLIVNITDYLITLFLSWVNWLQRITYSEIAMLGREITGRILLSLVMGFFAGIASSIYIVRLRQKKQEVRKARLDFLFLLFAIFSLTFSFFITLRTGYVISKQDQFLWSMRILSPYISDKKSKEYFSRFSLISSIDEYNQIMIELKDVSESNGVAIK